MRTHLIFGCTLVFASAACGGGTDVSVTMTGTQGLAASAQAAAPAGAQTQLLLHVVRTEVHIAGNGNTEDDKITGKPVEQQGDGNETVADAGWIIVSTQARDVDVVALVGAPEEVAAGNVPAGKVTQMRLILAADENATLVSGGERFPVTVPSSENTGLKLIFAPPVTIEADHPLRFDVEVDGVLETGNGERKLQPTAKVAVEDMPTQQPPQQ